jgi:hypothetical protein
MYIISFYYYLPLILLSFYRDKDEFRIDLQEKISSKDPIFDAVIVKSTDMYK